LKTSYKWLNTDKEINERNKGSNSETSNDNWKNKRINEMAIGISMK
jgi:hypothetical protein